MNHLFPASFKRLVPPGIALLAATVLFTSSAAQATPFVIKFTQQGRDVVANGSGEFDLTGLTPFLFEFRLSPDNVSAVDPSIGALSLAGWEPTLFGYTGLAGPTNFGRGGVTVPMGGSNGDGLQFGVSVCDAFGGCFGGPVIYLPEGYVSGSALTNWSVYDYASFASLGVTPGVYRWTWGSAADQSFTLMIGTVPEPAVLGIFGSGLLLLGGFATLRQREPPQIG